MTRPLSKPLTNDAALVERLRAGDASAVTDLSQRYGAKIFQLAFRYMKNREDAEEVAQDVLLKVFKKIKAFRGDAAAVVLDLSDHVQHRDVAAADAALLAAGGSAGAHHHHARR